MPSVTRLRTLADVIDHDAASSVNVSVTHLAVLDDGRRVTLLDDRGLSSSGGWSSVSIAEVEDFARMVMSPDEPLDGRSHDDMKADHWAHLEEVLASLGVSVTNRELRRLPHEIVLGERLLARLNPGLSERPIQGSTASWRRGSQRRIGCSGETRRARCSAVLPRVRRSPQASERRDRACSRPTGERPQHSADLGHPSGRDPRQRRQLERK